MYLGPNYIFNDDPKEDIGFLLSGVQDNPSYITGYEVKYGGDWQVNRIRRS